MENTVGKILLIIVGIVAALLLVVCVVVFMASITSAVIWYLVIDSPALQPAWVTINDFIVANGGKAA